MGMNEAFCQGKLYGSKSTRNADISPALRAKNS
jgi:hypothetical protein